MEVEQQPKQQPKQQHLEWRRNRVLELTSQGRTEREVAQILSVGTGTVHRDVAYLRKLAQDNLRFHVQERLPEQYQKCCNGLTQVLKMAWNIVIIDGTNNQAIKLQALSLISDCYKYQMDLSTNGIIVTDAIKYVNGKMDHLNNEEKKLLQDIKDKGGTEDVEDANEGLETSTPTETEQTTHNGIF
ncbi:MAG: hypothetical protein WBW34_09120 [Nitrososphaeraceae archaeon]